MLLSLRKFSSLFFLGTCLFFISSPSAFSFPLLSDDIKNVLVDGSYSEKSEAFTNLSDLAVENDGTLEFLQQALEGNVVFHKEEKLFYVIKEIDDAYQLTAVSSDEIIDIDSKDGYGKLKTNNQVRQSLRQDIARLQMKSSSAQLRKLALEEIIKNPSEENVELVKGFYENEQDPDVKESMELFLSLGVIKFSDDEAELNSAIESLAGNLEPVVINELKVFSDETEVSALKKKADIAISAIESKIRFYEKIEILYFGLSFGSVLVLAGIGLAITFGVMGVINMAHGELIMLGAYTTYVIQQLMPDHIGLSIIVAIPCAFMVSALAGIAMERLVIRHLYGRTLETLLATFGISLILQQAVRTVFSPLNKTVVTPDWMSGLLEINSVLSLTWNRLYIIIFCMLVFFLLLLIMNKTSLGLQVRAVAQNRNMARAMGVRSSRVDVLTFGLGSGIAGVAGVALSLLTNVGPNLGQAYIIDSFMVVVFGGVGNLFGTLLAGMSLGVMNKVLEPWTGAVLAKIFILLFIILFIQKRPQGLFPQRGRAAEN